MKPTGFMTNAEGIARELDEKCDGCHQHVKLLNGRASRAEVYPDELCFRILRGLMETMKQDGRIPTNGIGAVMAEEESEVWDQIDKAWDDVTGEELDSNGVMLARNEELKKFTNTKCITKSPSRNAGTKPESHPSRQDGST